MNYQELEMCLKDILTCGTCLIWDDERQEFFLTEASHYFKEDGKWGEMAFEEALSRGKTLYEAIKDFEVVKDIEGDL